MRIRPGYKHAEIGVMPKDWVVARLGDCCQIFGRIGFRGYTVNDIVEEGQGAVAISPSNIRANKTDFRFCTYISWSKYEESPEIKIFNGDILLVKTGSTYGKTAIVRNLTEKATLNPQLAVLKNTKINNLFLGYVMGFQNIQNQISAAVVGGALPTLSQNLVSEFKFPMPPTETEQLAIAETLTDTDSLIDSLEVLLAKKHDLKRAAAQTLLTGKRRICGFANGSSGYKQTDIGKVPADWDTPELRDILSSAQLGGNYKNSELETNWPLIKMGNLGRGRIKLDKIEFINSLQPPESRDRLEDGDVLFNTRNTLDLVGKVAMWRKELPEAYFNSNIMRMKFDERRVSSNPFMNYVLNTSQSLKGLREIAIGTTSVAAIYGRDLVKLKVSLPTKEEQKVIAIVLSDMDSEIAALEAKIDKYRQINQGMMQELLTGRTRLV